VILFWNLAFGRRVLGKYLTRNQGEHLIAATGALMKDACKCGSHSALRQSGEFATEFD